MNPKKIATITITSLFLISATTVTVQADSAGHVLGKAAKTLKQAFDDCAKQQKCIVPVSIAGGILVLGLGIGASKKIAFNQRIRGYRNFDTDTLSDADITALAEKLDMPGVTLSARKAIIRSNMRQFSDLKNKYPASQTIREAQALEAKSKELSQKIARGELTTEDLSPSQIKLIDNPGELTEDEIGGLLEDG